MQDQVQKLMTMGIYATYLGSAQFDKQVESISLEPNTVISLLVYGYKNTPIFLPFIRNTA